MKTDRSKLRKGLFAATLCAALPHAALAQFAMDAERQILRRATGLSTLEDMAEGESRLVARALGACMLNGALFVPANRPIAENPAEGANFRIKRLPENGVEIETVTTDETAFPRVKMALDMVLAGRESDCTRLPLPDGQLYRIASIDGAVKASELLQRAGVSQEELATAETFPSPPPPPPHAWRIAEEEAEGGAQTLLATLKPRSPIASEFEEVSPLLAMRCENGKVSAFVTSGDIIWDKRPEVTLRINDGAVTTHRWLASEDGKSVGLWSSEEALPFLATLADNGALFMRLRDRNLIYVEYDLANASETAARIKQACKL